MCIYIHNHPHTQVHINIKESSSADIYYTLLYMYIISIYRGEMLTTNDTTYGTHHSKKGRSCVRCPSNGY